MIFQLALASILVLASLRAQAFVLVSETYRIANHKSVVVNVGTGACRAAGMPDYELFGAITEAVENYWNTVTESELKLSVGVEVPRTGFGNAEAGEILIFCDTAGRVVFAGSTAVNEANGSAVIGLRSSAFIPGQYIEGALTQVITHEIGHALNLHHSSDPASIMTYEQHVWFGKPRHLSQDDKDGIAYLYPRQEKLSGLIPGCSAVAASKNDEKNFSILQSLISELILLLITWKFLRKLVRIR